MYYVLDKVTNSTYPNENITVLFTFLNAFTDVMIQVNEDSTIKHLYENTTNEHLNLTFLTHL